MENFLIENIDKALMLHIHGKTEESVKIFDIIKKKRFLYHETVLPLVSLYPDLFTALINKDLIKDTDFFDIKDHFLLPISFNFLTKTENVHFFINNCSSACLDYVSYGLSFDEDLDDFLEMFKFLNPIAFRDVHDKIKQNLNYQKQDIIRLLNGFKNLLPDELKNDFEMQLKYM